MATKKSKSSKKSAKTTTTKPKTAEKAVKTNTVEKSVKTEPKMPAEKKSFLSGFFAKKYEEKESILTVFKSHKFYGALLGELLGTLIIASWR